MLSRATDLLLSSYDFVLPDELIAQEPARERDRSRLLVTQRSGGDPQDLAFSDLPGLLNPGDLLLVNDTRVLPARLSARRRSGGLVRLLAMQPHDDTSWRCMVKPSARIAVGETLQITHRGSGEMGPEIVVGERLDGARAVSVLGSDSFIDLMQRWGEMPLPPYIARDEGPRDSDSERYQTLFAAHDGAVAAPTAGLHFSEDILAALEDRGVGRATVTLHVGAGTFAPVRVEELDRHEMHEELYRIPPETAALIEQTEQARGRIVCVGTTSARALESWHRAGRSHDGSFRATRLFLRPGAGPEVDFSLLTNFHLPSSTLLVLISSLLGRERALSLYGHAVGARYRFFSYGDACLFL